MGEVLAPTSDKIPQMTVGVRAALEEIRELRTQIQAAIEKKKNSGSKGNPLAEVESTMPSADYRNMILVEDGDAPLLWAPLFVLAYRYKAAHRAQGGRGGHPNQGGILGWYNFITSGRQNPYEMDESDEDDDDDEYHGDEEDSVNL